MTDNKNDDDDLMSDFRDMFADDESEDIVAGSASELDELDPFLEGFSDDLDGTDDVDVGETMNAAQDELEVPENIAVEDKDGATSDGEEVFEQLLEAPEAEDDLELLEPEQESGLELQDEPEVSDGLELLDVSEQEDELVLLNESTLADETSEFLPDPEEPAAAVAPSELEKAGQDDIFSELLTEETSTESSSPPAPRIKLDDIDLDLSVGSLPDTDMDESTLQEDDSSSLTPAVVAAALAAAASSARGDATPPPESSVAAHQRSTAGRSSMGLAAKLPLLFSSLAAGMAGAALIVVLTQDAAPQREELAAPRTDSLAIDRIRADVANLASRINELALIIEGPMSHLRQSTEEGLEVLQERLAKLEERMESVALAPPPPRTQPSPKERVMAALPAPTASPASSSKSVPEPGGWSINLVSLSNEKDARAEMTRLHQLGIKTEMQLAQRDGRTWYRLQVPGFDSHEKARSQIASIQKQAGVSNAWVSKD